MINRVNDNLDIFNNETLDKLSKVIEKQANSKTLDIVDNIDKANLMKKELKMKGFDCDIIPHGEKFKVVAKKTDSVELDSALETNGFKKMAWGRYCFERQSAFGAFKYDFDDGSIWRVMVGEDGKEYLVKDVDEDTDEVVRTKLATSESIINNNNVKEGLSILYDIDSNNNRMVEDMLGSQISSDLVKFVDAKIKNLVNEKVEGNHFIQSNDYKLEINEIVKTAIDTKELKTTGQLSSLIDNYTSEYIKGSRVTQNLFK